MQHAVLASVLAGWNSRRQLLGVEIWDQLTFHPYDHVFKDQSPFFQPADTQLIDHGVMGQAVDQIIEISVTYAQFTEPRKLLKGLGIYFLAHQFRALTPALFPRSVLPILAQFKVEGTCYYLS